MINKRGQFFGLYLVVLTLFMCGVVIGLFYVYQGGIQSSLVSPAAVLNIRDDLALFEMREVQLMKEAGQVAIQGNDFCDDEFSEKFIGTIVDGVLADDNMKDFIFSDLYFNGRVVDSDSLLKKRNFLEKILYSNDLGECKENERVFTRSNIEKEMGLKGSERNKINFPVVFSFSFGKQYIIYPEEGSS